eukprot:1145833-Pelagomonas_calceolata.AAC.5
MGVPTLRSALTHPCTPGSTRCCIGWRTAGMRPVHNATYSCSPDCTLKKHLLKAMPTEHTSHLSLHHA